MNRRFRVAVILTVASSLLLLIEIGSSTNSAGLGARLIRSGPSTYGVSTVRAGGVAAGLRDGDTIDLTNMDLPARAEVALGNASVLMYYTARAGDVVNLEVVRSQGRERLKVPLQHDQSIAYLSAALIFKALLFLVGLFVLWRGRDRPSLLLAIWCLGISIFFPQEWLGILAPAFRIPVALVVNYATWPFVLYLFVESVTHGVFADRTVSIFRAAMAAVVGIVLLDITVNVIAQTTMGRTLVWLGPNATFYVQLLGQAMIVGFFVVAFTRSSGMQRLRLRWVFLSLILSRSFIWITSLVVLFPSLAPGYLFAWLRDSGAPWMMLILFPLGCSYAILRHRIIDVNFVLNRALIYAVLTTTIIGSFILLERVFDRIAANRGVTLSVELFIALGVGLSFHTLHRRVEVLIERTLFRAKYRATATLRRLADEAPFIESQDTLLDRVVSEIPAAMRAANAAIYERSGARYRLMRASRDAIFPTAVDADEPVFVRLRKSGADIELDDMQSELGPRGHAFALSVRGELHGALVCGRRNEDERYSPDERELMRFVAHEVAAELYIHRARAQSEFLRALATGDFEASQATRDRARVLGAAT